MSSLSGPTESVDVETGVIGASLNSSMLQNFLFGMYTLGYAETMYLYMSRRKQHQMIALLAITLLYALGLAYFILSWFGLNQWMVVNGSTRDSIFVSTIEDANPAMFALSVFFFYSMFAVSDGFLVWRCYHVWGKSFKAIAVPVVTFCAESGLLVVIIVLSAASGAVITSNARLKAYNGIISSMVFTSLGTTLITTSLIAFKIYSVTHMNGRSYRLRFQHTVVIIMESAAAYSFVFLVYAIVRVIPASGQAGSVLFLVSYYTQIMVNFVAGMAPTVLMARIAITNPDVEQTSDPSLPHISELKFDCEAGPVGKGGSQVASGAENVATKGQLASVRERKEVEEV